MYLYFLQASAGNISVGDAGLHYEKVATEMLRGRKYPK